MRIRTQLLLPVLLLLAGIAGISAGTALSAARLATRQIETRLRSVARFVAEDAWFPLRENILRRLGSLSGAEYLLDSQPPLASFDDAPDSLPPDVPVADDWQQLTLGTPVRVGGVSYFCSGIRLKRGDNAGDVLYIFYPESLWSDARWEAIWPSLLLGSALGFAALALALWQARAISKRIGELGRRTRAIASGDFSPMPLPDGADEIRDLSASINDMAGQLSRLQDAVRRTERLRLLGQVSGGLAHQLRNGLTGARLAVQLHRSETTGDASALDVALRELTLLETHVKRLLDLGKAHATHRRPTDVTALVNEAVELLRPRCRHAGIDLRFSGGGPRVADIDEGQWGQLLVNLLTNAIEAAGPGGVVEVALRDGGGIVLEVSDSGPGPDDAVAGRLFEPFVTSKPEGVGLGLAVARQIAEGHGGKIGWRREADRTVFQVEVPT
jgi:signal transduction histidine kinase